MTLPVLRGALCALVVAGALGAQGSPQQPVPPPQHPSDPPGTPGIVLGLKPGGNLSAVLTTAAAVSADSIQGYGIHRLNMPPGVLDNTVQQLANDPFVLFAQLDRRVRAPELHRCWLGGGPWAQPEQCTQAFVDGTPTLAEYNQQIWLDLIRVKPAQAMIQNMGGTGGITTPITVAVIDTGIDPTHPVFQGRIHPSGGFDFLTNQPGGYDIPDGLDNDQDGLVDEALGHGSHVAGSILAVYPGAKILPLRALDADGIGWAFDVARAIFEARFLGARVINLSLSMGEPHLAVAAALSNIQELGHSTVVAAAGNTGTNNVAFPGSYQASQFNWLVPTLPPQLPPSFETVLTVSATDMRDKRAAFAGYGFEVDVCAPGTGIYSTLHGGGFGWWSGTSMSTGIASGLAALLHAGSPPGTPPPPGDVIQAIMLSTDDIGDRNPGLEGQLGTGRIDCVQAVQWLYDAPTPGG